MINDSLGDRMKQFEDVFRHHLPIRMPVIIRVDGKSFHSLTKSLARPFDENLVEVMNLTAIELCKEVQGCQIAYVQSDEISLLLTNYQTYETQSWFHNNIQKMVSVSASIAAATFTANSHLIFGELRPAYFDSRAFVLPKEEVCNYYLWRQKDSERNSVQMLARSLFSHKQCDHKNNSELQEMIHQKGQNWNDLPTSQKRGRCIIRNTLIKPTLNPQTGETVMAERSEWVVHNNIPIFSKDRRFIERHVYFSDQPKDADWHLEEDEMVF